MTPFDLLRVATKLRSVVTLFYTLVDDWTAKREIVYIMCEDLPRLICAYENSSSQPYENDSRISIPDRIPEVRLKAAVEATVNALYGLADVAANFGSKASQSLPSSFNALSKKIQTGDIDTGISTALGDVSWYQKVREIRTEWTHHSTVFVGKDEQRKTIFVVRDYRRPTDKKHFTETVHITGDELIAWTKQAIVGIDAYAEYLAIKYVLPKYPPERVVSSSVCDSGGFPKIGEDGRFETKEITIKQFFAERGIDLDRYVK